MKRKRKGISDPALGGVPPRQERAALLIASGERKGKICNQCGISSTTLTAWLRDPDFVKRVRELKDELLAAAVGRLAKGMAQEAGDVLLKLLKSKSESIRLQAVKEFYSHLHPIVQDDQLKREIDELKQMMGGAR